MLPSQNRCEQQCKKHWCCKPAKTNIYYILWCKVSSASNTLKPIAGNHRRNEGEDASPTSSYPLTLRASLFPGNHVEVLESYDVPNVFFSSSSGCRFIAIVILCLQRWQKACVTCCGAGKGKSFCVQSTQEAGKVSLPNVTVWDLPGTNRQKRKIHMDAHANPWIHSGSTKRVKNILCTQGVTSRQAFVFLSYKHSHSHTHSMTYCLFSKQFT